MTETRTHQPSNDETARSTHAMTQSQTTTPGTTTTWPGTAPGAWPSAPGQAGGDRPPAPGHGVPPPSQQPRRERARWPLALGSALLAAGLATGGTAAVLAADGVDDSAATTPASAAVTEIQEPPLADVPTGETGIDWGTVAAAVEPSVTTIQVSGSGGSGEGTGVVLDTDGHVLTNHHVVAGAGGSGATIGVVLADGRLFDATVVGSDPATDLAVLRLEGAPADLQPATFGSSADVAVGQPVMAVGNPLGLSDTVTTGIVSALDRPVTTQATSGAAAGEPVVTNAIQTDAAINPGNSGGPLVDAQGAVIGINSSIASTGAQAGSIGLGFAIPGDLAQRVAGELVADGTADHAWLGVTLSDTVAEADGVRRQAAEVADVVPGTPAADAGLRSGDAVVAVDGEEVSGAESLTAQVRERAPGAAVELAVVRNGSSEDVTVELGTRPEG
jgi:putative serine protease PepD